VTTDTPTPRASLSEIVRLLLARGSSERSSVTLTRNAAGATQMEVSVRTGDDGDVLTAEDAERKAVEIYARLDARFPASEGHDNASVSLTRNAKGETQVDVSAKTSDTGLASLDATSEKVQAVYDSNRAKYPMADGLTAKPGSVA
jgi:hypothetical protein